jgi:hypothetical protein
MWCGRDDREVGQRGRVCVRRDSEFLSVVVGRVELGREVEKR